MKNFKEKVLNQTKKIPKGKITTYKEIARAIGKLKASRAAGNALNKNPYAPKVPCHRVVKSTGEVGGYAKGINKKTEILEKEGIKIKNKKVVDFDKTMYYIK